MAVLTAMHIISEFLKFSKINLTSFPICVIMESALLCGEPQAVVVYKNALLCLLQETEQFFCGISGEEIPEDSAHPGHGA